jgi:DNA modification methylase
MSDSSALSDIHPRTPASFLDGGFDEVTLSKTFLLSDVVPLLGMSVSFARFALGTKKKTVTFREILHLLNCDAYSETFVPRSLIPSYLLTMIPVESSGRTINLREPHVLVKGSALDLVRRLPTGSIQCVVTSTPYWGTRIYLEAHAVVWADGEVCQYGHEQTPEGFIRHTIELLVMLVPCLSADASVWWNVMDTYNTRTQIRSNAAETLQAMRGRDARSWADHECRRYSAGHSFLKDGEQCSIPARIAERASRVGYWVKSVITWKKTGSMPETVASRVTRELEYIIHLSNQRTPLFDKNAIASLPEPWGGRNTKYESDKLTDVWALSTASGSDGHGAQFPVALPARCIALTTRPGDYVLDPFVGSGTTAVAAALLGRHSVGFDISAEYLETARARTRKATRQYALF